MRFTKRLKYITAAAAVMLCQEIAPKLLSWNDFWKAQIFAMAEETEQPYGSIAYSFLQTFTENYPSRLNEENNRAQSTADAGIWIAQQLESFGYTVDVMNYEHMAYTGTNYAVTKKGNSDEIICIGAHYDCVDTAGVDDNGSGVSVLLELAKRFADEETPCTVQFVFFDNEENGGYVGSYHYVDDILRANDMLKDVLCYINIDSVGAGDHLLAYGGVYEEDGTLTKIWPYQLAHACADVLGIALYTLPEEVEDFKSPTRSSGSDHYYFREAGIPYLYFEASLWSDETGTGGNDETRLTCHYQTMDPAFASTGGQIMHTEFDDFSRLNELLPGRLQSNLASVAQLTAEMIYQINPDVPDLYEHIEEMTESDSKSTEEEETTETEETTAEDQTASEAKPQDDFLESNHRMIILILSFAAAVVILAVSFVIYASAANTRRRKRRRRIHQGRKTKTKKKR